MSPESINNHLFAFINWILLCVVGSSSLDSPSISFQINVIHWIDLTTNMRSEINQQRYLTGERTEFWCVCVMP